MGVVVVGTGPQPVDVPATRSLGGQTVESVARGRSLHVGLTWNW
jgi:hypothetical protein